MHSKRQEYNYNNKKDLKKEVFNIGEKYSYYTRYLLGRGATSTVYLGFIQQTQEEVAVKVLKQEIKAQHFDLEVEILKKLNHPHIIRCIDDVCIEEQRYIILEYCHSVSLTRYITFNSHVNEKRAFLFFSQIVSAMTHLREHQIIHRDLKPDNILVTKKDKQPFIKLIDFGYAKILDDGDFARSCCGTPAFMAPEVLKGEGYTETADMWSLGCILYNLLYGVPPFQDRSIEETKSRFASPLENFQLPKKEGVFISPSCADIIMRLLTYDHKVRITISELCVHQWFQRSLMRSKTLSNNPAVLSLSVHNVDNNNSDNNNGVGLKKSQIKKSQNIIENNNNNVDNNINNENNNENGQIEEKNENEEEDGEEEEEEEEGEEEGEGDGDDKTSERMEESEYDSETMYSSHKSKIGNKIETIVIKHNRIKIVTNYLDHLEEKDSSNSPYTPPRNNNNNNINNNASNNININKNNNINNNVNNNNKIGSPKQVRSDEYINKAIGLLQKVILNTQSNVVWKILPLEKMADQNNHSVLWKWTSIYYSHRRYFAIQSCFFFIYYYRIIGIDSENNNFDHNNNDDDHLNNNQYYKRNKEEFVIPMATCSLSNAKKTLGMLNDLEAQLASDTPLLFRNLYRLPSSNFVDFLTKSNFASASSLLSSSTLNNHINNNMMNNF